MTTNIILAAQAQGGGMQMIIMMVVLFAIMYFFMIRPQQKKQKEIRNFQNSIVEGTAVVTAGGIHGTVKSVNLEKGTLDVEVAKGMTVTIDRTSVFAEAPTQQK